MIKTCWDEKNNKLTKSDGSEYRDKLSCEKAGGVFVTKDELDKAALERAEAKLAFDLKVEKARQDAEKAKRDNINAEAFDAKYRALLSEQETESFLPRSNWKPPVRKTSKTTIAIIVVALLLAMGGVVYFLKYRKPQENTE